MFQRSSLCFLAPLPFLLPLRAYTTHRLTLVSPLTGERPYGVGGRGGGGVAGVREGAAGVGEGLVSEGVCGMSG